MASLKVAVAVSSARQPVWLAFLTFSIGCGALDPIQNAAQKVTEAASSLRDGMDHLSRIDPMGLRHLLEKNENLRAQLEALDKKMAEVGLGTGVFQLQDKRLYLQVASYQGAFVLNGWIDDRKWWFVDERELPDREVSIASYGFTRENVDKAIGRQPSPDPRVGIGSIHEPGWRGALEVAEQALHNYVETASAAAPLLVNGQPLLEIALNDQFLTDGDHQIVVEIKCVNKSARPGWFLRGRIVARSRANKDDIIKEFDWSEKTHPSVSKDGSPPSKVARVRIRSTTSAKSSAAKDGA